MTSQKLKGLIDKKLAPYLKVKFLQKSSPASYSVVLPKKWLKLLNWNKETKLQLILDMLNKQIVVSEFYEEISNIESE